MNFRYLFLCIVFQSSIGYAGVGSLAGLLVTDSYDQCFVYNTQGQVRWRIQRSYLKDPKSQSQTVTEVFEDSEGRIFQKRVYTYAKKQLVLVQTYNSNDVVTKQKSYEYNGQGNVRSAQQSYWKQKRRIDYQYGYTMQGQIQWVRMRFSHTGPRYVEPLVYAQYVRRYTYKDRDKRIDIYRKNWNGIEEYLAGRVYKYAQKTQIQEVLELDKHKRAKEYLVYQYNSKGQIQSLKVYQVQGYYFEWQGWVDDFPIKGLSLKQRFEYHYPKKSTNSKHKQKKIKQQIQFLKRKIKRLEKKLSKKPKHRKAPLKKTQ